MDHFQYRNDELYAESVPLTAMMGMVGTPFYCYSSATLLRHYRVFDEALSGLPRMVCFAVKANSNIAVLATLAREGAGADVVSEGEIRQALAAGISPQKMIYSGVGKTKDEMRYALEQDVFQFNVESLPELRSLSEVATSLGRQAAIAVRVNPDVDPKTHEKISTGQKASKFGIPCVQAMEVYNEAAGLPGIRVQGVSVHIGSQLTSLEPFKAAFLRVRELVAALRRAGHVISTVDLGGGLGIPYSHAGEAPPLPDAYGQVVRETMQGVDATLIFEPGRMIAGNSGVLVTKVIYIKEVDGCSYVIVDAAMNDLLRPSLYEAIHEIVPVLRDDSRGTMVADIVGPVCESGDTFATRREIQRAVSGDLLAFRSAGAYGAVMGSTYNARPLAPEVLVHGESQAVIRPRLSYEAMLAAQKMPDWL